MRPAVIVTGGAGYIGSHTCKRLHAAGFHPVSIDNLERGNRDHVRWGPLEEIDLRQPPEALIDAFRRHRPIAVLHFAAYAYVSESMNRPVEYHHNNLTALTNVLLAMAKTGVTALVFSSSCAVYGEARADVITEDHPCKPINPYGLSKLLGEQILASATNAASLRCQVLRYFNAGGADPDLEIGERHEPETHIIPLLIRAAMRRGPSLEIYGKELPTTDGTCVRDFIHVMDLADAHVLAVRRLLDGQPGVTVNLGTGIGHSLREVIAMVETITGRAVPYELMPLRPGDPPALVASNSLAHRMLGWEPRLSDLETIVRTAHAWDTRDAQ